MCDRLDCSGPSVFMVGFSFEAVGGSPPAFASTSLRVCTDHSKDLTVEMALGPRIYDTVRRMMAKAGKAEPDPSSFRIVLKSLN